MPTSAVVPGTEISVPLRVLTKPTIQSDLKLSQTNFQGLLDGAKSIERPDHFSPVESKLTQMLLAKLFELMLPRNSENLVGGSGTEDHWRTFLADAVAESAAKSGKFDLRLRGERAPLLQP